ncbi:MAG: CCA tRNA nucleotidyltransferase [Gemmatimonadota bacterium]
MTEVQPSPPPAVRWITRRLVEAGYDTWAVGGAVRDVLLGLPAGDWDLTTRARPKEVRKLFPRTVPIGVEHGTVGILADDGTMFEITTFRRDVHTDGRRAVVAFADEIEEDLGRRDFTINAIAWHPLRQEWLDPFGGRADLEARTLRAVGEPERRFAEDHLRVLRALRFAGRFGLSIERRTWRALREAVPHVSTLSAERVREELVKVLDADPTPSVALDLYARSGALAVLYPEIASQATGDGDRWSRRLNAVDWLPRGRPFLRLASLLRPLDSRGAAQILLRLRLSNAQIDETARLASASRLPPARASAAEMRRWLSAVGAQRLSAVARLELAEARGNGDPGAAESVAASWRAARRLLSEGPPLSVSDLAVDGGNLIRMGLKPGPTFGRLLESLLSWVLEDPSRNQVSLLEERAKEILRQGGPS